MLADMPANLVVPTVCINNRIYFVDKLLQTSDGTYFISHHFFYWLPKGTKISGVPIATGLTESGDNPQVVKTQSVRCPWVTEDPGDCNEGIKTVLTIESTLLHTCNGGIKTKG